MWNLYAQARQWRVRPSEILGIDDAYVAYCLDEAVSDLAAFIEDELDKVKVKSDNPEVVRKRKMARLDALLSGNVAKQFADPAAKAKRNG